jgi:parallel beta-helix repeat protein
MNRIFFLIGISILILGITVEPITKSLNIEDLKHTILDGNTLYVGGSGPGNYSKIQYAINNATDGERIFVYNGIYRERLIVNKSIDLVGEDRQNTVIDGGGTYFVVHVGVDNVSIKNFYINNSGYYGTYSGIMLKGEIKNITIENNIIIDNFIGICIGDPYQYKRINYVNITNNYIIDNDYGIFLIEGQKSTICNNIFINNGIFISRSAPKENNVQNNTINGLPLVYYEEKSNIIIPPNVGQIILVNCEDITISSQVLDIKCELGIELLRCNNCNVVNNNISNKYYGIYSYYSNNINIQANEIKNGSNGIKVYRSDKQIITFNRINVTQKSIEIDESSGHRISYNTITNGRMGIDLRESCDNIITNNYIDYFLDNGINLYYECNENQILNNTIKNCLDAGIIIFGTKRIWWDSACIKNVVSGNEIKYNRLGIVLEESAITNVFLNNVIGNRLGVELRSARYNKIFKNNIYDNSEEDAILKNSFSSRFYSNFWNETKRVHLIRGGIYRWDFWSYVFYEVLYLPRFDLHAVAGPYNIGV